MLKRMEDAFVRTRDKPALAIPSATLRQLADTLGADQATASAVQGAILKEMTEVRLWNVANREALEEAILRYAAT
jgi:hypothetical protein